MSAPRLELDFLRRTRPGIKAGGVLLALGAAAAVAMFGYDRSLREELAAVETRTTELARAARRAPRKLAATGEDSEARRAEIERANSALERIALPWNSLFMGLENAQAPEVALTSVEPDAGKRNVELRGEGKNLAAVLAYLERLAAEGGLTEVYLTEHTIKAEHPEHPIEFAAIARWGKAR